MSKTKTLGQTGTVLLPVWRCQREECRHRWVSRSTDKPKCCAKCKSPYWDRAQKK